MRLSFKRKRSSDGQLNEALNQIKFKQRRWIVWIYEFVNIRHHTELEEMTSEGGTNRIFSPFLMLLLATRPLSPTSISPENQFRNPMVSAAEPWKP